MNGFNLANITDAKYGSAQVKNIYKGTTLIWPTTIDYSSKYLTIKSLVDNNTITFTKDDSHVQTNTFYYSLDDGSTWTAISNDNTTNAPVLQEGQEIIWKANATALGNSYKGIGSLLSSGNIEIYGNAMSLLYGDNFIGQISLQNQPNYIFFDLFGAQFLTSAENLVLPATTLVKGCYDSMFYDCSSLTKAPKILPALYVTDECYQNMFYNCSSLVNAPELPATGLNGYCYFNMFYNCSSLVTAPALLATTLVDGCYYGMFGGCSSLVTAPELPATTLAHGCYYGMFYNCSSLTTAPALPATTLADECYSNMFESCSSLTTAPELPATVLPEYCYYGMFKLCESLNYVKCLATSGINEMGSTTGWLNHVSSTGTFVKAAGSTWPSTVSGIPSGWTVVEA